MADADTTEEGRRRAEELLRSAVVGYLAVSDADGPYVVPVSFAYHEGAVCFHGGVGRKSQALAADPRACLAVTTEATFIRGADPCKDNFAYESAVASGSVVLLEESADKEAALRAIVIKYDPTATEAALNPATLQRTLVYRMPVTHLSYKHNPNE